MLLQYRFKGVSPQGRTVQGTFNVKSIREAKDYVAKLVKRHQLKIEDLEKQRNYAYTVYLPGRRPVRKYQSAFSKEELSEVLTRMGYTHFKITPVWFDIRFKPPMQDILLFIQLSANMLKDKMTFSTVLEMLSDEQTNSTMRETLLHVEHQLKSGADGMDVFSQYEDVFGHFPAYMLGLAMRSGNIAEVFEATAKFMQRDQEIRRSIKKALISPFFAILATLAAVVYYVQEIFPATAELFLNYNMELPRMTMATLELSHWLQSYGWILLGLTAASTLAFWRWKNTIKGRMWYDAHIIRLPILGHLIHKTSIEMYFWVFATNCTGAGDNIATIRVSAEACRNTWMEHRIKTITIPQMLQRGEAFVTAMEASGVFTKTAITRLKTGQESGNVLQAAHQIAKFYESETTYKLNNLIDYIQTLIALFIAVIISLLTIISSEIATIAPPVGF